MLFLIFLIGNMKIILGPELKLIFLAGLILVHLKMDKNFLELVFLKVFI